MRATRTATATRKHNPALPLYTTIDAARALTQLQPVGYNRPIPIQGRGQMAQGRK